MASTALVDAIATIGRATNFLAAQDRRFHSFMVLCENRASRAAPRRIREPLARTHRSCWWQAEIRTARLFGRAHGERRQWLERPGGKWFKQNLPEA
jgi:hypothetical protein